MTDDDRFYKVEESCQITGLEYIYQGVFGRKANGTFVEVGAYDGRTYSNTWCLAELGWHGLYVEPIKEFYDRCVGNHKNHPNVRCVNEAIGDGSAISMKTFGGMYTGDPLVQKNYGSLMEFAGTYETMPLHTILFINRDWINPIDVLVIDVEGMEQTILSEFAINVWKPKFVIIEMHQFREENAEMIARRDEIHAYFTKAFHYSRIYADHINSIYVKT